MVSQVFRPACSLYSASKSATLKILASEFTNAAPSGFTPWGNEETKGTAADYPIFSHWKAEAHGGGTYTRRYIVNPLLMRSSASKVKVEFMYYNASYVITEAWIGLQSLTGDLWDMDPSSMVQLKQGGNSALTITAADRFSDEIDFVIDGDAPVIVSMYVVSTAAYYAGTKPTGLLEFYKSAVNEAGLADATGYTAGATNVLAFRGLWGNLPGKDSYPLLMKSNLASNGSGNIGRVWRAKILPGAELAGASKIRLLIDFVASWSLSSIWIGYQTANAFEFDGNQVQLFFGGAASHTFVSEEFTDWIDFDIDPTKTLIISAAITTSAMPYGTTLFQSSIYATGGDTEAAQNTLSGGTTATYTVIVAQIFGYVDGVPEPPSTLIKAILDQRYMLAGGMVAILSQPYGLTSRQVAVMVQVYGLRILAVLAQHYGDVPAVRQLLEQYYGSADMLRRICNQPYGDALQLRQLVDQEWSLPGALLRLMELRYSIAGESLLAMAGQQYNISEYALLRQQLDQVYLLGADSTLVQRPTISVTVDGVAIDPHHISIEIDEGEYAIKGEIHLADQAQFLLCHHLVSELVITIDADEYHLIVEAPRRSRPEVGRTEYYVTAASRTILLDAPYAATITRDFAGAMASAIVDEMATLGGVLVDWQMVDWYIPAGTLYANSETPMAVISKIVSAAGGIKQTSPAGVLICRPEYPLSVNSWDVAAPAHYLTDMDNFFSVDSSPEIRDGFNRYLVSNQEAGQIGLTLEQVDIDATTKEVLVYQVPFNDASTIHLRTSGGSWVSITDEGIVTEDLTELVEIVAGEGRTQKPIYSLGSHIYKQTSLGTITTAEDGNVATAIMDNSLVEVVYTTKYRKFRVVDALIEDVQFYPEEVMA